MKKIRVNNQLSYSLPTVSLSVGVIFATTASENDDSVNYNLPVAFLAAIARAIKVPSDLILAASCRDLARRLKLHAQLLLVRLIV